MLQEISQALCISFEDVCRLQQDNLDLFYWFEKKLEDVEKEYEEKMEGINNENIQLASDNSDLDDVIFNLEHKIEELEEEVKGLQGLLDGYGIDYTEVE